MDIGKYFKVKYQHCFILGVCVYVWGGMMEDLSYLTFSSKYRII